MTKKPMYTNNAIFVCLPIFDFSPAIFKEHSCQRHKMSRRLGEKARQNMNNESSLETNDSPNQLYLTKMTLKRWRDIETFSWNFKLEQILDQRKRWVIFQLIFLNDER